MFTRVSLFIATNILVIATISIITNLLGLNSYLNAYGINYASLALFCAIWGTGGAFISLLFSKSIAKMTMGVQVIHPAHAIPFERSLVETVYKLATKAGLSKMPEVGIYQSPELNAFATGPSQNDALVAVSTGLLANMSPQELEGVLGHEIAHIKNGDMITMTLLQGVVNAFSMFLSRIIAYTVSIALKRHDDDHEHPFSTMTFSLLTVVFDILFTLLGSIIVASFSRWREFRADAGGAHLAGRASMITALQRLHQAIDLADERSVAMAAFKISRRPSWLELFSSHPPLEQRIDRLLQA